MSGSLLGRGRAGRHTVYAGCVIGLVLLVFLYRVASTEMTKIHDLHLKCVQQLETSGVQFQELQQRATREKTLRDKESVESMNRFSSLQQSYKTLKTENQDIKEECENTKRQAIIEKRRLDATVADLRNQVIKLENEKKSVESLKSKHFKLEHNYEKLEEEYQQLLAGRAKEKSDYEQMRKDKIQLQRELEAIKSPHGGHKLRFGPQQSRVFTKGGDESVIGNFVPTDNAQMGRPASQQQQQSSQPSTSKATVRTVNIVSKLSNPEASAVSPDKAAKIVEPVRSTVKVKLPHGVVPIPKLIDLKKEETLRNSPEAMHEALLKLGKPDTDTKINERVHDGVEGQANDRHVGENIFEKFVNHDRLKVQHGVQEIGDEPQHMEKSLNRFANAGKEVGDEQYDNDYNYKGEQQQPKNDLHLEESEDEGEDEDDQLDYPNNFKDEKRE